ncbi:hypothetical protein IW262DRAFT_1512168 [Armillaria fumosa]|nr:hypothetical protein IW262DRAFT_1512168 [Armillaria fumosa]
MQLTSILSTMLTLILSHQVLPSAPPKGIRTTIQYPFVLAHSQTVPDSQERITVAHAQFLAEELANTMEGRQGSRRTGISKSTSPSVFPRPDETPWHMRWHQAPRKHPLSPIPPALIPENHADRKQPTVVLERLRTNDIIEMSFNQARTNDSLPSVHNTRLHTPKDEDLPSIFRPSSTPQRIPRVAKRTDRSCTPPPPDQMLGPATQPPYLPDNLYSCRPEGPRVFDQLQMLDMRPFGVLAWTIIEREEEIFESDDIRDEHKVMHALWARWILLNRSKFIANYCRGITEFVDEYWPIIHKAAGWKALRFWLLTMLANRYLKGEEVSSVLKFYESKTQMDLWYDE